MEHAQLHSLTPKKEEDSGGPPFDLFLIKCLQSV